MSTLLRIFDTCKAGTNRDERFAANLTEAVPATRPQTGAHKTSSLDDMLIQL